MVVLNRIYTRTGDDGTTALGTGERRKKYDLRIACYGTVDETNAAIGLARLAIMSGGDSDGGDLDAILARIQNDLFDLGADLCSPDTGKGPGGARLSVTEAQVTRLESEIDEWRDGNRPGNRDPVLSVADKAQVSTGECNLIHRHAHRVGRAERIARVPRNDRVIRVSQRDR